jgi:hypothetical protein
MLFILSLTKLQREPNFVVHNQAEVDQANQEFSETKSDFPVMSFNAFSNLSDCSVELSSKALKSINPLRQLTCKLKSKPL